MTTPANIPLTPYERIMLELTAYAAGGGTLPKPLRAKVDGLLTDAQPEAPKAQGEAVNDSDCLACGHIINVHYKWGCGVAGCTCNAFIGGAAKASPPAPAPVKGEDKCVHCGKVMGEHGANGFQCWGNRSTSYTPPTAPQPTEQKAQTPAPDAELAAAKEALVQKTLKHVEHVRTVGFTRPLHVTAQAVLDAVDIVVALESRKAVKVEGEWPKVFISAAAAWVMVDETTGVCCCVDGTCPTPTISTVQQLRSHAATELPRAEVPAWLEKHGFNTDGTRKAEKPASTHRYRLLEDGIVSFGDGSLEALQEWVNKIAAEDKAVQP